MPVVDVTTWTLEMTSPDQLLPGREPSVDRLALVRVTEPSPEFSRFLYVTVGGEWHWTDRLGWDRAEWLAWLDRPELETWVLTVGGAPAGYFELEAQRDGDVEIAYFGLLGSFTGRGLGGHLLTEAIRLAWDRGSSWAPDSGPARRVWVHTCTLDGPHALANYTARGLAVVGEVTEPQAVSSRELDS